MKAAEIRSRFLKYFEKNGHTIVESSSLVPHNDPTLLFTSAGMVQFKDAFLGKDQRNYSRATSAQKCVRAGGKHNDLENVGVTARHHTFFEMLGNFSFGDYFKNDAIRYAWEFTTQILKLPKDRLYVTVYEKDDEAAQIWHEQEGVPLDRIYKFGEKDNFWSMGESGPCGPCSELFFDRGIQYSCGKDTCAMGCDCDRFMEFWNLVFMQYDRSSSGVLNPLPRPSVDTGSGLERLASILQDVDTNYDCDLFQDIIGRTAQLADKSYDPKDPSAVSFRVVADHSRASVFLISDGVLPSNEGRGYVLRRIMRRAIRHGKKLGFSGPFLAETAGFVIDQMKEAYPDLVEKRPLIEKVISSEEEQFLRTLEKGLILLDEATPLVRGVSPKDRLILSGEVAFKLYDTFGFPLDLTRVICGEKGYQVDEVGFEKAMDRQRSESRKHWKGSGEEAIQGVYLKLAQKLSEQKSLPQFSGYEIYQKEATCVAILAPDAKGLNSIARFQAPTLAASSDSLENSQVIEVVFSETPFYGESGGQMGDRGRIIGTSDGFEGEVIDVQKPIPQLIIAHVIPKKGTLTVGQVYRQETDQLLRDLTAKNHTATHLLQWALREVLGKHVKQAGSLVTSELLRFDFTHFQPVTDEELEKTENLINGKIWQNESVTKKEMAKDEAVASGAIAFFGEKYGDRVRVVQVGTFSTELCGGSHVDRSSDIHLFKIANESGIASGVRRIIAYTSQGAYQYLRSRDADLKVLRDRLKASSTDEILGKLEKLMASEKELRKQIESAQARSAGEEVNQILNQAHSFPQFDLVTAICKFDSQGVKKLRDLSDRIHQKKPKSVVVLGMSSGESGGKAFLLVSSSAEAQKWIRANELLQQIAPYIEGKGGGKADLAQAGGSKSEGLDDAVREARTWIENRLGIN